MVKKLAGIVAGALVVALAVSTGAQAGSAADRATGGGQTLVGTKGAGNTIAFTAQGAPSAAKGQVQYISRAAGTGQAQVQSHGVVSCLRVNGNQATIGGTWTRGERRGFFEINVVDNGQGAAAANDVITIDDANTNADCDRDDDDQNNPDAELARGNAQVYDAP